MMLKGLFSISMAALLLAVIAFAALEMWTEIHARQGYHERTSLEEPARASHPSRGAEASPNY